MSTEGPPTSRYHCLRAPPKAACFTHPSSLITHYSSLITLNSDPRVEEPVDCIGGRVDQDIGHRYGENTALGQLVVALVDAVDQQGTDSRPRKNPLGDYCTGQQDSVLQPYDCYYRDHPVLEDVLIDDGPFREAFGPGRSDVVLVQLF